MMDLGHSGGRRAGWRAWGSFFSLVLLALAVLSLSAPKPDSLAMTTGAPDGALQEFAEKYVREADVSISTITIYDVPSLYPATGKLAAVKLVCAMRIQFPHVGVSVTVTGEDLFLFYNGTKVGTLMMGDLDVARGGQSLSTSTVLILTLIDPAVARAMGNAGMYQREFHVQMAGTLRVKVLGDRNGCVLTGEPKRFCIDGWIPNVRIAKTFTFKGMAMGMEGGFRVDIQNTSFYEDMSASEPPQWKLPTIRGWDRPPFMHVPHPFATSAFIRTYNPSSFSLQAVQRMYGDLHLEEYNPRLGRPNTSGMTALEAARASPRGGTFDLRSFAVPIGYSGLQPVSALLAPEGEAGRTVIGYMITDMLQGKGLHINALIRGFSGDAPAHTSEFQWCRPLTSRGRGLPLVWALPEAAPDGSQPPDPRLPCDTHPAAAAFFNAGIAGGAAVRLPHSTTVDGRPLESVLFGSRAHIRIDIPRTTAALLNPLDGYLLEQWIRMSYNNPFNMTLVITGVYGSILSYQPKLPDGARRLVGKITQPDFAASGILLTEVPPYAESYVPPTELPLNLNVFDVPILMDFMGELTHGGTLCDIEMTMYATVSGIPVAFSYTQKGLEVTMNGVPPSPPAPPPQPPRPPPSPLPQYPPESLLPPPDVYGAKTDS